VVNGTNARAGGGSVFAEHVIPTLRRELESSGVELVVHAPMGRRTSVAIVTAHANALRRRRVPDLVINLGNIALALPRGPQWLMVRNRLLVDPVERRRNSRNRVRSQVLRWSMRASEVWIVPSSAMAAAVQDFARELDMRVREIWVLPHGQPNPPAPRLRSPRSGAMRILYPAIPALHKNFQTLLEAVRLLRSSGVDARVTLTVTEQELQRLTNDAPPSADAWVHYLGRVEHVLVRELYQTHDVVAFPSTCESFGLPLIEARAAGLPVVASDLDVFRELGDEHVYLCPPDEASVWAHVLRRVCETGPPTPQPVTRTWDDVAFELARRVQGRLDPR
jgi:glycosyltransferase involved in cell wall biosynthesis